MLASILSLAVGMLSLPNLSLILSSDESKGGAQDPTYLRSILPSGAIVVVENMPGSKYLAIQLIASSHGVPESKETHGWRHLLEHLLEKGTDKRLESRLEAQGMFLSAETHRDALQFTIIAPPEKWGVGLSAVKELLQPLTVTEDELKREASVLAEEQAIRNPAKRLSPIAWIEAFGEAGLDPAGDAAAIAKATPAGLEILRRRHFAPQNVVVSVCGPGLDLDLTTRELRDLLPKEKGPFEPAPPPRLGPPAKESVRADVPEGEAFGVVVPGWDDPQTAAVLAAGLALASERDGSFVIYTPSVQPGLVLLGANGRNDGFGAWLGKLGPNFAAGLFGRGRALAEEWLQAQMARPEGRAFLRGFLYAQSASANPERLAETIRTMEPGAFTQAVQKFAQAVTGGGGL